MTVNIFFFLRCLKFLKYFFFKHCKCWIKFQYSPKNRRTFLLLRLVNLARAKSLQILRLSRSWCSANFIHISQQLWWKTPHLQLFYSNHPELNFINEKEKTQNGHKTFSSYSALPTHHSLPWWFRDMRLDGSWKPGSTRSRRPWAEVWSTLS